MHLTGQAGAAGVDRARRKRARGGGRSSGETRARASGHRKASWGVLRACGDGLSTMVHSGGSSSGSGHDGDEARRRRASAVVEEGARGRNQVRGVRGREEELTGSRTRR